MRRLRYLTYVAIFSALLLIAGTPAFSAEPMDETNVSTQASGDISNQGRTEVPQVSPKQPSTAQHSRVETNADLNRGEDLPSADVRSSESGRAIPEASSKVAPGTGTDVERQSGEIERRSEERQVAPSRNLESGTQLESRSGAIEGRSEQREIGSSGTLQSGAQVERDFGVAAQRGAPATTQAPTAGAKAVGFGVVTRVDRADNCLRIRQDPSTSSALLGCAKMGEKLELTGAFSHDGRWAQLTNNGWVFLSQIKTDIKTPKSVKVSRRSVPSEDVFEDEFLSDWETPAGTYSYGEFVPDSGYYVSPGWYGYRGFRPLGAVRPFAYGPGLAVRRW